VNEADTERTAAAALDPEEQGRANLYGLISRLYYAPADPNLLAEIARGESQDGDGALVRAWGELQDACRNAFPAVVRQEYDTLFVGVGRAQVSPYLSGYAEPTGPDRYLVRLLDQLAAFQLARQQSVFELEDHISGACDVMRWLIESRRDMAEQLHFFEAFVLPGAEPFCAAVQDSVSAGFYKSVACFTVAFLELEKSAFEMSDLD
jgi:TorA maturation chaperone TorD